MPDDVPGSPSTTPEHDAAFVAAPRTWTAVLAPFMALGTATALQLAALGVLLALGALALTDFQGTDVEGALGRPEVFLPLAVAGQLAFLLVAGVGALLSPTPFRERLGLVASGLTWWAWPLLALTTLAIRNVSLVLGAWVTGPPSDQVVALTRTISEATGWTAVSLVVALSVLPGVGEEALFRGYVQRRLLQRWPAWVAITFASVTFGAAHFDPQYVLIVLPLGFWLGIVAWWTGSTWPGVACHAFNNAVLIALGVLVEPDLEGWGEWTGENVAFLAGSLLWCAVALPVLARWGRPQRPPESVPGTAGPATPA